MFPRRLDYDWILFNEKEIEKALDEYIKELKRATRLNKKQEEKNSTTYLISIHFY